MKQTGDLNLVKKLNKSIVLDYIRSESPISRADIAKRTGLTKATVSTLVSEWIESRLVQEIGTGSSSGGRKPVMLTFHERAGFAVGVDLGVNYMAAALTDLNGNIIHEIRHDHDNESREQVVADLIGTIEETIRRAPASPYGIVGIGVGIPGIADEDGNVVFAPNLGWTDVPLQKELEQRFQVPVVIDNEANAGAIGEKRYGAGKDAASMLYVSIGMGIGAGIIVKGELYRGASGFSGEVGHMSIQHDGAKCRCGSSGCWEQYASENALLEEARRHGFDRKITVDKLRQLAEIGDDRAIGLFEKAGRLIGVGIVNLINGFNPELIVIGGRLTTAAKWLERPLQDVLLERSLPYPRSRLNVQISELAGRSTLLGACSFAIDKFFSNCQTVFPRSGSSLR